VDSPPSFDLRGTLARTCEGGVRGWEGRGGEQQGEWGLNRGNEQDG
jgi:hypothetical protein